MDIYFRCDICDNKIAIFDETHPVANKDLRTYKCNQCGGEMTYSYIKFLANEFREGRVPELDRLLK